MYTHEETPYQYYPAKIIAFCQQRIQEMESAIIDRFYDRLLNNPKTAEFLTHESIQAHLKKSMVSWLDYTFDKKRVEEDPQYFIEYQNNIGKVHSRINISLYLINYAKVILKRSMFEVGFSDQKDALQIARYLSDVIDYSVDLFNESYLKDVIDNTRHRQSLRIISTGHQLALDMERGKGELSTWVRDLLWSAHQSSKLQCKKFKDLNFIQWLHHKGSFTFNDETVFNDIVSACDKLESLEQELEYSIDKNGNMDPSSTEPHLEQIIRVSETLINNLDQIIEHILSTEKSQDSLTKTLSRRYLPSIAQKEVMFARHTNSPFSILMIDIDHFKQINDRHGHRFGDTVLEGVAQAIIERLRPGDYVFRYGGEEFLALINETTRDLAQHIAEDIRHTVQITPFSQSNDEEVFVTVSIGCAQYDFHPDFMKSIDRADGLLYEAKSTGRNRVCSDSAH